MSHEEQAATVGRLVLERADINRQCSLLFNEIQEWGTRVGKLSGDLSRYQSPSKNVDESIGLVDGMIAAGGADRLRKILDEYRAFGQKVADISQTLRNAGAE